MRLVTQVRDLQIVDSDGIHCGIVDDIELEGKAGGPLKVKGLVVGPGGYSKRLPAWWLALVKLVAGKDAVHVPWSEVEHITSRVCLGSPAVKLGLGKGDRRAARLLPKTGGVA
jgi:sporulation protein YlmC with PRC-barrel domain